MMETIELVRNFDQNKTIDVAKKINSIGKLMLTGEGSSRIFPAKNVINKALNWGVELNIITEGSRQAAKYNLSKYAVFCASNSGKTKEVISLVKDLKDKDNNNRFALTANTDTPLERFCTETFLLQCGLEKAVAATKSVVEQGLFYESILWNIAGRKMFMKDSSISKNIEHVLTMLIDPEIIKAATNASTLYFAGYNDGVAEELTLKTNEITRKKSDFLEGTYAVHGIEEVLEKNDLIFVIDPIDEEIEKFQKVLVDGVGSNIVAIATKPTPFKTIIIPDEGEFNPYLFLCTGWNLLVEIGLALNINLDKPNRARKVGNEFIT